MRTINEIVVHHSAVNQSIPLDRLLISFNNTHKTRLHDKYRQPKSRSAFPHIAYHCLISDSQWTWVRDFDFPGYHASNYRVNLESVGICVNGNFDVQSPNAYQLEQLELRILDLKKNFPAITKVSGHRDYSGKTCPGKNMKQEYIDYFDALVRGEVEPGRFAKVERTHPEWMDEGIEYVKKHGISDGTRPTENIMRGEVFLMFKRTKIK